MNSNKNQFYSCRPGCGACCIIPSISSAIPGMEQGKPAGVPCVNLAPDFSCTIFNSPMRPKICGSFRAEPLICGNSRHEALQILAELEGISI